MSRTEWVRDTLIAAGYSDEHADRVMAEVKAEGLTESERTFLTFALELAADVMASRGDEFTDKDEAALASLRGMASASVNAGGKQPETEAECHCRRDRDGNGEGWIKYRARDGEFVELRCRDHKGGA